jgi:hypothetical protein
VANKDDETSIVDYPLPKRGVNLYINPVELHPEEAVKTQNLYWRNGLVKKPGSTQFDTDDEVQADKKISGLHRFYYSTSSKQLLVSSGTAVRYHNGTTWANIQTGLTDGNQVHFATWGALQKVYFGNGADELYSWDGSSAATINGGAVPSSIIQVLPYQDRLLAIDATNPGTLTWSDAFSTTAANWEAAASTGVKPDSNLFGMVNHSINNSDAGYESAVLLAGSNGMYLFKGSDLRTPATTGNYTIYPLATSIGCNAPRTMVWTPRGTVYMGIDKQVYLLQFNTSTPVPIGQKITSLIYLSGIDGIEDTPAGQIHLACAVYHDGFYKLSLAPESGTTNSIQWWLDIDKMATDENGLVGPWFGPMTGETFSCFAAQTGNGDSGELMAGDGTGATGKSLVYQAGQRGINATDGTAMEIQFKSFYNPLGSIGYRKEIHNLEVELKEVTGTTVFNFTDIDGSLNSGGNISLTASTTLWGTFNWGDVNWSSALPIREQINISPAILPRRLSIQMTHSSATDTWELYALRAEVKESNLLFQ